MRRCRFHASRQVVARSDCSGVVPGGITTPSTSTNDNLCPVIPLLSARLAESRRRMHGDHFGDAADGKERHQRFVGDDIDLTDVWTSAVTMLAQL